MATYPGVDVVVKEPVAGLVVTEEQQEGHHRRQQVAAEQLPYTAGCVVGVWWEV